LLGQNATSPTYVSSNSIFINSSNIYLTGSFYEAATFAGTALNASAGNEYDIFIAKYDLSGTLMWAKQAGGSYDYEYGNAITADNYGNVYITGECGDTATFDNYTTMGIGSSDWGSYLFWGKYDSAGNMLWIKTPQQSNWSWGESILSDPSGNIYVAFGTADSCIFSNDTSINFINILKSDTSGTIQWIKDAYSSHRGGFCCESVNDIAYYNGAIYGMGNFYENASFDNNFLTSYALYSVFLAKLHLDCSAYFTLTPDSIPYHYTAINMSSGEQPLTYSWDWGDGNFDFTPYPSHIYADTGTYTICLSITDNSGCSNTYCSDLTFKTDAQMVYVNVISSVNEEIVKPQNNSILVYPNPATTELTIVGYNPASLKLCNTLGQTIAEANNTNKLWLGNLPQGIYLLQVFDNKGALLRVEKVLKE
ncbi:MAG: PKD domain-containing protein, partial [Bacteroidia bacterium]